MSGLIRSSLLLFLLSSTALAQDATPSGTAVRVNQNANAAGGAGARVLLTQGAVYQGDLITTDNRGIAQIIFVDNTRFVVGPNSKASIDRFVFNPDNTAQAVTITATKGAFRFISGISRSQVYAIRTPAMTIGVRGTTVDFTVEPGSGRVTEAVTDGAVINCDSLRVCVVNQAGCGIVVTVPGGPVTAPTGEELAEALERLRFLGEQQDEFPDAFKADTSACASTAGRIPPPLDRPPNDPEDPRPDRPRDPSVSQ